MTRLAYDMSVRWGRCQYVTMIPVEGSPFADVASFCDTPTRGLTVYLPLTEDGATTLRVSVCPMHLHELWERFGLSRGEAVWQADPAAHEGD